MKANTKKTQNELNFPLCIWLAIEKCKRLNYDSRDVELIVSFLRRIGKTKENIHDIITNPLPAQYEADNTIILQFPIMSNGESDLGNMLMWLSESDIPFTAHAPDDSDIEQIAISFNVPDKKHTCAELKKYFRPYLSIVTNIVSATKAFDGKIKKKWNPDMKKVGEIIHDVLGKEKERKEIIDKAMFSWERERYMPESCDKLKENNRCPKCQYNCDNPLESFSLSQYSHTPSIITADLENIPEDIELFVPEQFTTFKGGQYGMIMQTMGKMNMNKSAIIKAGTGYGKTGIMTTSTKAVGKSAIIVEPDKGLQNQLFEDYGIFPMKGKGNYWCPNFNLTCDIAPCTVKKKKKYKCNGPCDWLAAKATFEDKINKKEIVSVNFGNMFNYLWKMGNVDMMIIDEFHEILLNVSQEYPLDEVPALSRGSKDYGLIMEEERTIYHNKRILAEEKIKDKTEGSDEYIRLAREINRLSNKERRFEQFIKLIDNLLIYNKKGKWFCKLEEEGVMKQINETTPRPLYWVSATPTNTLDLPIISTDYQVARQSNAPIYDCSHTSLTSTELRRSGNGMEPLRSSVRAISALFEKYKKDGITEKAIVHTINLKHHASITAAVLRERGYRIMEHARGNMEKCIKEFKSGDYDFLVVASAGAGHDFKAQEVSLQFILKVPYPYRHDPMWGALEEKYGKIKTDEIYVQKTVDKIVQISGRVCRSEDTIGITIVMDGKFGELLREHYDKFPQEFLDRLVSPITNTPTLK